MKYINIDKLTSAAEPVAEVTLGDETLKVYKFDDMPERIAVRVVEANASFVVVQQEVNRELARLDKELADAKVRGTELEIADSIMAQRASAESRLVRPMRQMLEAIFGVEPDTLSALTPSQLREISEELSSLVFTKPKTTEEIVMETLEPTP